MKTIGSILMVLILSTTIGLSQSKKELEQKVSQLTSENQAIMNELLTVKQQMIDLKQEFMSLKNENELLRTQVSTPSNERSTNESLGIKGSSPTNNKPAVNLVAGGRCQAITAAGNQCSRNADPGSNYCWQHKSTYEPNNTQQKIVSTPTQKISGSSSSSGRTIYTGPRGGRYYINSHGNKTYIKK
jgi:type II secretory pathway pseudopilin PulG